MQSIFRLLIYLLLLGGTGPRMNLTVTNAFQESTGNLTISSWNNLPFGTEKVESVEGFKLKLMEHTMTCKTSTRNIDAIDELLDDLEHPSHQPSDMPTYPLSYPPSHQSLNKQKKQGMGEMKNKNWMTESGTNRIRRRGKKQTIQQHRNKQEEEHHSELEKKILQGDWKNFPMRKEKRKGKQHESQREKLNERKRYQSNAMEMEHKKNHNEKELRKERATTNDQPVNRKPSSNSLIHNKAKRRHSKSNHRKRRKKKHNGRSKKNRTPKHKRKHKIPKKNKQNAKHNAIKITSGIKMKRKEHNKENKATQRKSSNTSKPPHSKGNGRKHPRMRPSPDYVIVGIDHRRSDNCKKGETRDEHTNECVKLDWVQTGNNRTYLMQSSQNSNIISKQRPHKNGKHDGEVHELARNSSSNGGQNMQDINKNWGPWSKCTQVSLNIVVKTRERHCDSKIETCNQKNSDMESVNCLPEGRKKGINMDIPITILLTASIFVLMLMFLALFLLVRTNRNRKRERLEVSEKQLKESEDNLDEGRPVPSRQPEKQLKQQQTQQHTREFTQQKKQQPSEQQHKQFTKPAKPNDPVSLSQIDDISPFNRKKYFNHPKYLKPGTEVEKESTAVQLRNAFQAWEDEKRKHAGRVVSFPSPPTQSQLQLINEAARKEMSFSTTSWVDFDSTEDDFTSEPESESRSMVSKPKTINKTPPPRPLPPRPPPPKLLPSSFPKSNSSKSLLRGDREIQLHKRTPLKRPTSRTSKVGTVERGAIKLPSGVSTNTQPSRFRTPQKPDPTRRVVTPIKPPRRRKGVNKGAAPSVPMKESTLDAPRMS